MKHVIVYLANGDKITTRCMGTISQIMDYYFNKRLNVGTVEDNLTYACAIKIDAIAYNVSTHRYLSDEEHARNKELIKERRDIRAGYTQPLVGDFIIKDGHYLRFTHDWDDYLQTTNRGGDATDHGGFHLHSNGKASYSGGLDPSIKLEDMELTSETKSAQFWIFSNNSARAHNGISFYAPCKVYRFKEKTS